MTLLAKMQSEMPQAIRGVETLPGGMMVPIIGTVGADGSNDIDPAFWDLLKRETQS